MEHSGGTSGKRPSERTATASGEPNLERLLTAAELGAYLGLAASTILDRFERGDLPGFKLWGKHGPVRFRASDVAEFLSECRVETKARAA